MRSDALFELAETQDIQLSYLDLEEKEILASPQAILAALQAMGVVRDEIDVQEALSFQRLARWSWHIEPVVVNWRERTAHRGTQFSLRVPLDAIGTNVRLAIKLETGATVSRNTRLIESKATAREDVNGSEFVEFRLRLPRGLPPGYHRLSVETADHHLESLVISAASRVHQAPHAREWGVFLPLYALHSAKSWGIGDYGDLRRLTEWAHGKGASVVATLPLLPTFVDRLESMPFEPSPYQPLSRLFWNEVFVDPEAPMPGGSAPHIKAALRQRARTLTAEDRVDYGAVMALKREALSAQADAIDPASETARELDAYIRNRPDTDDYAKFRAALERLGPDWRQWPAPAQRGELTAADYDERTARFFRFAQWRAHSQMQQVAETAESLGMRSYLDLPVGVHSQGYDAWRFRPVMAESVTVGTPPDLLATNGQNWGFHPLNPLALRASGYDYLVRFLRHYFRSAKMLRIDHAIGLHRLYWIPDGATGRDGVFVRQPAEEMYAVLCLESVRNKAVVVAEDLGLVPSEVRRGLSRHGISGMYVQMFEMTGRPGNPMRKPKVHSVASFSTHDLPPFAAYWQDDDLRERERLGLLNPERVREEVQGRDRDRAALVKHLQREGLMTDPGDADEAFRGSTALLAASQAQWVVLNLEDTWSETRMQNLPGTDTEHPNWVNRARYDLAEFDSVNGLTKALDVMREHRPALINSAEGE